MAADDEKEINTVPQDNLSTRAKRKLDGNMLMSFAAIFLSAGTLFILIYQSNLISKQFELQQQQQFASAMPYLMLGKDDDGSNITISLTNHGLGPAFVEAIRVYYKDTVFENLDLAYTYDYLQDVDENIITLYSYSTIFSGQLISPQETKGHLILKKAENAEYDPFSNGDAQLEIEYRSIYNERWRIRDIIGIPEKIESKRLKD